MKCLCSFDLADPEPLRLRQEEQIKRAYQACLRIGREFLLEIIPSRSYPDRGAAVVDIIRHLYSIGIRPDWWKLEPFADESAWRDISEAIAASDRFCRGVLILGLTSGAAALERSFRAAAGFDIVRGFAVGRAIVAEPAEAWLKGEIDNREAQDRMRASYLSLIEAWTDLRPAGVRVREGSGYVDQR